MKDASEKKKRICQTYNDLVSVVNGLKMGHLVHLLFAKIFGGHDQQHQKIPAF